MKTIKARKESFRILAKGVSINNNTWKTGINNNDIIVGPSGANKTRGYVIPNMLHGADSMIITDTKGNLCKNYGDYLKKKGYDVMHLDFTDTLHSPWGYNPLAYIRKDTNPRHNENGDYYIEQDVQKIASVICPIQSTKDVFWDYAARMYLECFVLFVMNYTTEQSLAEVYKCLSLMGTEDFTNVMEEICELHPNSAFTRKYRMVSNNSKAEKMDASIKGILAQHLDVVCNSGTMHMFEMEQQVKFENFLKKKTVLFLSVSDSDRSQDSIVNLFYTQALQYLLEAADAKKDSRLPIPVRFILDDFSTNTVIPDFDNIISVIRSREIYVSLIIQSITQLEDLYGSAKAQTILNNCDNCLFLGGTDPGTADYFAKKLNRLPYSVLTMPLDTVYLFTRGEAPKQVKKYDLNEDEIYQKLIAEQSKTTSAANSKTRGRA